MKKILLTGGSGFLGERLVARLQEDQDLALTVLVHQQVHAKYKDWYAVDLLNTELLKNTLKAIKPDIIIHTAAITHIDRCEDERGEKDGAVWKVNVVATGLLADYCRAYGCKLIFFSSECVFDGKDGGYTESDIPSPLSWYGATKVYAEELIQEKYFSSSIIRTQTAYNLIEERSLIGKIKKYILSGQRMKLVNDHYIAPTHQDDIVELVRYHITHEFRGIIHCSPAEYTTPYELGCTLSDHLCVSNDLLTAVSSKEYFGFDRSKLRPQYAYFNTQKLSHHFHSLPDIASLLKKQPLSK